METIFKCFAVVLLFLSATGVQAQEGDWYAAVGAGVSFPSDNRSVATNGSFISDNEFDTGYVITGAAGKYFNNFRLEGEIFYGRSNLGHFVNNGVPGEASGHVRGMAYMANAYFDIQTNTKFTPYIGAGIGYADLEIHQVGVIDAQGFAFQFKAGTAYQFTPSVDFIVGYRYFDTEDLNYGALDTEGAKVQHIEAAIRYRF